MLEATTDPVTRRAIQKAHSERAVVVRWAWNWLSGRSTR